MSRRLDKSAILFEFVRVNADIFISAGMFGPWLKLIRNLSSPHQEQKGMNVPCGDCVACCTSFYFIHIRPDEDATLSKIPKELLFDAPGLPEGHMVMGFDEEGACPMFMEGECSIYSVRPVSCRQYDCRIFSATELKPEDHRSLIAKQASGWAFELTNQEDELHLHAIREAAKFLLKYACKFSPGFLPGSTTQLAVFAINLSELFLEDDAVQKVEGMKKREITNKISEIESFSIKALQSEISFR